MANANGNINGWRIVEDRQGTTIAGREADSFVVKRPFGENFGLSLYAKKRHGSYEIELAIEKNRSVESCFRIDNTATETEAIETVHKITSAI